MAFDLYQAVTDRIIAEMESGIIPWQKPWSGLRGGAFNRISKKTYSLLNQLLLNKGGEWASFKQWSSLGGKIRKGEKSSMVVFWKPFVVTETKENENGETETTKRMSFVLRYYNVFHISQVEGVDPLPESELNDIEPIDAAEKIRQDYVAREHIKIEEVAGNRAFYSPMMDYINVPQLGQFREANEFYSTLFHEMTHSTGHKSRLNRFDNNTKLAPFGSEDYSKEELVAEMGSAFLCNTAGIETNGTLRNSAAYLQSWLNVLKGDKKFIVSAASKAQKAVNYILGIKENEETADTDPVDAE